MSYRRVTHKTAGSVPQAKYEMKEVPAREDVAARLRVEQEQRRLEEQARQQEVLRLWGWKGAEQIQAWEEEARFPEKTKIEEMMHHIDRLRYTKALEKEYERKQVSISFYEKIGYPKYAGYEPFSIPKGYEVAGIVETPKGLSVTFKMPQKEQPISLTEKILTLVSGRQEQQFKQIREVGYFDPLQFQRMEDIKIVAGIVAVPESLVYNVGRIAGLETPEPPPTLLSGLLTSGISSAALSKLQASHELKQVSKYGPTYAFGTIAGDIFLSYTLGYAIGKVAEKPAGYVTKKVSSVWRGSKAETWLIRHSERYASYASKQITAPQIVSYPQVVTEKGYPIISKKIVAAQTFAWELELTKRTSGITVSKFLTEQLTAESLPHLIFRHGAISIGYLQQPLAFKKYSDILVPETTEAVTKRAFVGTKLPYIPTVPPKIATPSLSWLTGFAVFPLARSLSKQITQTVSPLTLTMPKQITKPITPQLPKRKTKTILRTDLQPLLKEEARTKSLIKTISISVAETETIQLQTPKLTTTLTQKTLQIPKYYPPKQITIPKAPTLPPYRLELPRRKRKRRGKDLFGAWFKREHKIATPKQVAATFGFSMPKSKKRKKKRRR